VLSEVSGTAKTGMHEQKLHMRHHGVVKVAQHTEGDLLTVPEKGQETKAQ